SVFGNNCSVGTNSDIQGYCTIGKYCRFHSYVNIGQKSEIGNFVFIYPFVVLTNDPTPPSDNLVGAKIGDFSQVAAGSVLLPGSIIGKHSLISANSTVGGSFDDDSFISGNPAKKIGMLSKMPFFNQKGKRHYPWPYHFKRGLPWAEMGYDEWLKQVEND
ncbi:MAG: acyltransferase, partial [Ignavibacterium sp.]